jgi:arsenate reductase
MTYSNADDACPVVAGAEYRTTIKYEDPKIFDGTDQQESAYRERSLQIGREMLYTFSQVSRLMR